MPCDNYAFLQSSARDSFVRYIMKRREKEPISVLFWSDIFYPDSLGFTDTQSVTERSVPFNVDSIITQ